MLISFGKLDEAGAGSVTVDWVDGAWCLSADSWAFTFDVSLAPSKPDIALLAISRRGQPRLVWGHEVFNERAAIAFAMGRNDIAPATSFLAAFAVEADATAHCFVMGDNTYVGSLDCVITPAGQSFIDVFQQHVPSLRPYIRKALAKRALLGRILYADSLAALEAQLDLLTQVVAQAVHLQPESERSDLSLALTDLVATHGVGGLHSQEKLLADITAHKHRLRDLQRAYLAARSGGA